MPITSQRKAKVILAEYETIKNLKQNCSKCEKFRDRKAEDIVIYSVEMDAEHKTENSMLAIAEYGNEYAIYSPEYLNDDQLSIFQLIMLDANEGDKIVVFSERDYNAIKKYNYGKNVNVELAIV